MKSTVTTVFIIGFLFFPNNVFAIQVHVFKKALTALAQGSIKRENVLFVKEFENLERKMGFSGTPLRQDELVSLRKTGLDPVILQNAESKKEVFRIVESDFLDSILTLRWWKYEEFRDTVFDSLTKDRLGGNEELLLKWWEEAKLRGQSEKLEDFVTSSFKGKEFYDEQVNDFIDFLGEDEFLGTVFRAIGNSDEFASDASPVINRAFQKKYPTTHVIEQDFDIDFSRQSSLSDNTREIRRQVERYRGVPERLGDFLRKLASLEIMDNIDSLLPEDARFFNAEQLRPGPGVKKTRSFHSIRRTIRRFNSRTGRAYYDHSVEGSSSYLSPEEVRKLNKDNPHYRSYGPLPHIPPDFVPHLRPDVITDLRKSIQLLSDKVEHMTTTQIQTLGSDQIDILVEELKSTGKNAELSPKQMLAVSKKHPRHSDLSGIPIMILRYS